MRPAATSLVPIRDRSRRRSTYQLLTLSGFALLSGCSAPRPLDPDEQVVRAVLQLLASDNHSVCVDDATEENALAVFRQMTLAPRPSRVDLRWFPPKPLRPDIHVTTDQIRAAELHDRRFEIPQPSMRADALPGMDQIELTGDARRAMMPYGSSEQSVAIRASWVPPRVSARWWVLNRVYRQACWPQFVLSNVTRHHGIAFVSVRAEHWGTLYALEPAGRDWRVTAEWSRWVY